MTLVEALRYHASLMIAPEVAPKVRALLNDASTVMWAAAEALSTESETVASGWAIQHADRKRWRTMDTLGCPDWTDDPAKALVCRLKEHIELYAQDDDEDIRIVQVGW
jgi:hypothetical protein